MIQGCAGRCPQGACTSGHLPAPCSPAAPGLHSAAPSPHFATACTCTAPQILCMHGGLSPELKALDQIKRVPRPTDVPDTGLLCDLLWADPDKDVQVGACVRHQGAASWFLLGAGWGLAGWHQAVGDAGAAAHALQRG